MISNDSCHPAYEAYTSLLAHELRTPVTAIYGYLQLLDDDGLLNDPEALRAYLAVVRGRAADLARVVSELTTFADLTAGRALSAEGPAARTLPDIVRVLAGNRPTELHVTADASALAVADDRLRLVLEQLLDNAFKFGTPGATVTVRAERADVPTRLIVRITNLGEPIPDPLREAIFEPFRQAEDHLTRRQGGLGLGLAVARRAAEGAGGGLVLEPGAPTTFRLELPWRQDAVARQATALREEAARADAQALRAIRDMRALREVATREHAARELAEAQQLRAVQDFRGAHREALALTDRLRAAYLETITALAKSVEARDDYTGGHIERVRRHSLRIGKDLGLGGEEMQHLEFGAVLHDVGKIGVPDAILGKPGQLDPEEWQVMRRHPEIGRRVLEGISFLAPALDAVLCHHERWDGRGYPSGLAGDAIPLAGRIVAVADTYDAMTSDRPYRQGLPAAVAIAEIEKQRGAQFDPDVARAFLRQPAL